MRPTNSPRRNPIPALALTLALILSACSAAVQTTAPTAAPTQAPSSVPILVDPTATEVAAPTATSTATAAPSATSAPTETSAPTAVPSPTPDPALSQVTLSGLAWMPHYDMLLSFNFPGPVNAEDYRVTLEDKEYRCEVLEQYPNRLYCYGPGAKVLTTAIIRVFPAGSDQPGYEKSYWIPYFQ